MYIEKASDPLTEELLRVQEERTQAAYEVFSRAIDSACRDAARAITGKPYREDGDVWTCHACCATRDQLVTILSNRLETNGVPSEYMQHMLAGQRTEAIRNLVAGITEGA